MELTAKLVAAAIEEVLRNAKHGTEGLDEALDEITMGDDDDGPILECVGSYAEKGILTSNDGFVLTFTDGSEFQVTVVQSRRGK